VRGEIWTVTGGADTSKPRLVMIMQARFFSETDSVSVLPLTTTEVEAPLLRMPITAAPFTGLAGDSWLMIDKVTTIRRASLGERVGWVHRWDLSKAEHLLAVFLGIAGDRPVISL